MTDIIVRIVIMLYFEDGKIIAQSGEVKIYDFMNKWFLEIGPGHNLWAISDEIEDYKNQIGGFPRGDCLEIGLGLGIVSKYILEHDVKSLTTIEINEDVINVQEKVNPIKNENHKVIIGDGLDYLLETSNTYDFIFIDNYSLIDEDIMYDLKLYAVAAKQKLNKGGIIKAWWDVYTPKEFEEEFNKLFK